MRRAAWESGQRPGALYVKAIVVGMGNLGFEVARRLVEDGCDTVVIDVDGSRLGAAKDLDVLPLQGNGASPLVLSKANVPPARVLLAVTDSDEVNMVACLNAKQLGVELCAARIRNPEYLGPPPHGLSLRRFGIDFVLNPEHLAAREIVALLRTPMAHYIEYFADGQISLVGLKVEGEAPITRGTLAELAPAEWVVGAVVRDGEVLIPDGNARLYPGDRVFVFGRTGNFHGLREWVGLPSREIRDVVVLGGGKIGYPLLQLLVPAQKRGLRLKVIERDPERCERLAEEFPSILVIEGDGEKVDVLQEERVGQADAFVASTGADHTNLLATMVAKDLGVREAITVVTREEYAPLAEKGGADAVVIPRLIVASSVMKLVRHRHVVSVSFLEEGRAQVMELSVEPGSRGANKRLRDLHRIPGTIVGCIVRDDQVIIPKGDVMIKPGDHVVVLTLPEAAPRMEALFRG